MINKVSVTSVFCRIAKFLARRLRTGMREASGRPNPLQRYREAGARDTGRHQGSSEMPDMFAERIRRDRHGSAPDLGSQSGNGNPVALPDAFFQPAQSAFLRRPN
jgi:hypothetical protein